MLLGICLGIYKTACGDEVKWTGLGFMDGLILALCEGLVSRLLMTQLAVARHCTLEEEKARSSGVWVMDGNRGILMHNNGILNFLDRAIQSH